MTYDDARTTAEAIRDHLNADTTFKPALQGEDTSDGTSSGGTPWDGRR